MKYLLLVLGFCSLIGCASNSMRVSGEYPQLTLEEMGIGKGEIRHKVTNVVPPMYPASALRAGLEGYCIVKFNIDPNGETFDQEAIECTDKIFRVYSILSAKKTTFEKPMYKGKNVIIKDVNWKVSFAIAK